MSKDIEKLKSAILKKGNLPVHVAIIMDGNGRWAKSRGMPRLVGHRAGAVNLKKVVRIFKGNLDLLFTHIIPGRRY